MTARSPVWKRRSKPRRVAVVREPEYLAFLREEGRCPVCLTHGAPYMKRVWTQIIDPAHGKVNGYGSKGSDLEAIPLCRLHHDEMEKLRWPKFCAKYKLDRQREIDIWQTAWTIWKVHREGEGTCQQQ